MNIKKIVSAVAASAMLLTSAFSLAINAGADTTLQPLKEIRASAEISGYTDEMLKKVPLSEILDAMTYSEDVYEDRPVEETPSESLSESTTAPADASNSEESTAPAESSDSSESTPESTEETVPENSPEPAVESVEDAASESAEDTDSKNAEDAAAESTTGSESVPEEAEPAAQANTESVLVHSAGEKVEFASDAKYVWVGDQEYSISDRNATVDLRAKYDSAQKEQYTLSKDIIVGKAKQLSPTDIIYNVTITVNQSLFTLEDVSFYYMKDGKKTTINAEFESRYSSNTSNYENFYYKSTDIFSDADIYVEATPAIADMEKVTFTITEEGNEKTISFPYKMRKYSSGDAYVNLNITAKDGDKVLYSKRVYIRLETNSLDMVFGLGGYSTHHSGINAFIDSDRVLNINCRDYDSSNSLTIHFENDSTNADNIVEKIVVGKFATLNAASGAEDVKSALTGSGYEADYENGAEFTVFFNKEASEYVTGDPKDEYALHIKVTTTKVISSGDNVETDFDNAFFRLYGVKDESGNSLNSIMLGGEYDSYFKLHYQTALVYSDNTVDMSKLKIYKSSTGGAKIYGASGTHEINFDEPQDFTNGTINYVVAANGGQGYYPVTVKCNSTGGAELFVNGPTGDKEREVYFDSAYGMYHDIIIANIGDAPLEGVKVTLSGESNVKLDDYWRLDGEKDFSTLGAFTSADSTANLAKIRLRPETDADGTVKSGEVSGTLTVTADGQQPVTIKLIGHAGNPEIVTESPLPDAVKYVPYSVAVATDNIHDWNKVTFELWSGKLPEGVELNGRTGEIYGVPQETGEFHISIRAVNSYSSFSDPYKEFDITVKENTDDNVYYASDEGYEIIDFVGTAANTVDFVLTEDEASRNQIFRSNGEYGDFIDFWLNGKKLAKGTDYTSEEGSTVITIRSQTLSGLPKGEANTIAAEFRVNGKRDDELKRAAQNFTIKGKGSSDSDPGHNTGDSGSTSTPNTSDNTSTPNTSDDTSAPSGSDNTNSSTPSDNDIVFKPIPVSGDMADIINGMTVTAPQGVMSKDAVLTIIADRSVPADKGAAFDITFTVNGEKVQPSGDMTVRMPIPDNLKNVSPLYVYHITNGKYELVNSWRDGDFMCFKASGFSTYVISGKKLDSNGNPVSTETTDTSNNPLTGIGVSATGIILSAAILTILVAKKKH